jgi:hypothetical protein
MVDDGRRPRRIDRISGETLSSGYFRVRSIVLLIATLTLAGDARAEPAISDVAPPAAGATAKPKAVPAVTVAPKSVSQPTQQPAPPGVEQVLYLIRSTLLTLNDANRSGNYTVLRDLAAPDFQARNTAADLAVIFTDLRRRNFDLFAVALTAPQLTVSPALDANKLLRLTGLFPTRPLQINFDLVFEVVNGRWCLDGISVATPEAPPQAEAARQPAPTPVPAIRKPPPRPQ